MHWSLYVLIGATINVAVNAGYKILSPGENMFLMGGAVTLIGGISLLAYAFISNTGQVASLFSGTAPFIILAMGIGVAVILVFFVTALTKGQLSLVDPAWACIYALVSVGVGMVLLKENPGLVPLLGVGLYISGAVLMMKG